MFRPPSPDFPAGRSRAVGALIAGSLALIGCVATAACGVPPELQQSSPSAGPTPTPTATATPTPVPTPTPPTTVSPTSPSGLVPCAGNPTQAQVTALLRRSANLPGSARVSYSVGPLCAANWQFSVVTVAGREPLQAVTTGRGSALRLVTAGTEVCTIRVRTEAPTPIRTAACDAAPSTVGGL
ncbi:hypothetical protein [Plantactinospora soyae]|uniref:Uncharacterized protein n=1 Tax=Plantactinospora soyae TaxID=1544732 RepID=A0A927M0Y4_9ACTN|nr:hypothetical protein [Plantactinospora soyae]MBE1486009.1 hypothetical protein [Plantactinospora soyae]